MDIFPKPFAVKDIPQSAISNPQFIWLTRGSHASSGASQAVVGAISVSTSMSVTFSLSARLRNSAVNPDAENST